MSAANKNVYFSGTLFAVFAAFTALNARETDAPFDVSNIIEAVRNHGQYAVLRADAFLLDTHLVYVPADDQQEGPAIAFDGTNYLVVWSDRRISSIYVPPFHTLFGARVSANGILLDSAGILISDSFTKKWFPAVCFNGENYLAVWHDDYDYDHSDRDIHGARVTPDGIVLDPDGILISDAPSWQCDPAVASDGLDYFVVWADVRDGPSTGWDLYGSRVTSAGVVLDPDGILVSSENESQGGANIVFDGVNYFAVWDDYRNSSISGWDIYGARITPGGVVIDTHGIAITTEINDQGGSTIAVNGTDYLVAWRDKRHGGFRDIYCSRVTHSGVVLDTAGIYINSTGSNFGWEISSGCDGGNFLVAWHIGSDDVHGARVSSSGVVLDTVAIPISEKEFWQLDPAVAFGNSDYFVAWSDGRDIGDQSIYGARVDTSGTVLDPNGIVVSGSANNQTHSSVAFDGNNYFVVWQDTRTIDENIYGMRIDSLGAVLDPACIAISAAQSLQRRPAISFDGINYFVVWDDARDNPEGFEADIYGARVNQSGIVLDTTGIPISCEFDRQRIPAIVFGDSLYLVVWEDRRTNFEPFIYAARVHPSGSVLDTAGIVVSNIFGINPAVTFDGTNYFTVWKSGGCANSAIYGARINQSGVVIDPFGIVISAVSYQDFPSVAYNGLYYFVVWKRGDGPDIDIYGARVSTDGVVLDPGGIALCTADNAQRYPFVSSYGDDFLVIWEDRRDGHYTDLYGVLVDTTGLIVDSFAVCNQPGEQTLPAIVQGSGGQSLITYTGWADSIGNRPANTMRIWGKFYPFVGVEEDFKFSDQVANFSLQVYPNPVKKVCRIKYSVPQKTKVNISVYDVTGRLVKKVIDESQDMGIYQRTFNVANLSQGVYVIRLNTEGYSDTKKVIFIK